MDEKLTNEEKTLLEWIASESDPSYSRRARLLLLRDQGFTSKEIGLEVGLSAGRVRHWMGDFREKRMGIFPSEILREARAAEAGLTEPEQHSETLIDEPEVVALKIERPEITLEELCQRYMVDMAHARHVAEMTLALFDLTAEIHGLSPQRRELTEIAAILHNVGFATYPEMHHTVGRDILLEYKIVDMDETEQMMVACSTAFHRKKFRPRRLKIEMSFTSLPPEVQDDALVMAALVRMGDGLDYSQSQTSTIGEVQTSDQAIEVLVTGSYAGEDAARAQEKADFWHRLFDVKLHFQAEWEPLSQFLEEEDIELEVEPPKKLKDPGVLPDDPMSEAGRKVLRFHFQRMLEHEPGTRLGEDIEELHDMRVATRRMRSAFRVFNAFFDPDALRPFLKGLQRTGRALGSVRDLDVFMEKARRYRAGITEEERSDLDPLLAIWQEQRDAARAKMLAHLDSKRYQVFVGEFDRFLSTEGAGALPPSTGKPTPVRVDQVVPAMIFTRYGVVRGYEAVIENASLETLHALRIDCKRFRYAMEFFREVLGPEAGKVIEDVVVVQDHLGDLQDADVACHLLIEFLDQWSEKERRDRINISGVTGYLVAKQSELRELVDAFPEIWHHFNRIEIRRTLAKAISEL
jgi:CHAD domain-containing protein